MTTAKRVRLMGGALNGRVVWVEKGVPWLDVNVAAGREPQKRLRYRIDGDIGSFESELEPATNPAVTKR